NMKNTVLIVDDTEENIKLAEAFLTPEGYDIVKASTGEECLEILKKEEIDIILLDVLLPGRSGFEVCSDIKNNESTKLIPVIMVTALKEKEDRIKGIKAGADDFLTKPVDRAEMKARIKSLLRIKDLNDKLKKSYEDLKKTEKLKEDLSDMLVHDMNNILTNISLNLESISMNENIESGVVEDLNRAYAGSRELIQMAANLIDISRMEENALSLKIEKVDVGKLLSTCADELKELAKIDGKEIRRIIDVEGVLSVKADKSLLKRVIINLLSNALKYAPKKSAVTVRASFSKNSEFKLSVSDKGEGISSEFKEKIFGKYEQMASREDGVRGGKGLGLYFCRMAVEAHGGRIWAESKSGKGSTFKLVLPV
ncbi:MAG: ATP-binding response regulator, partial [Elusimicrobiota bacterium]